MSSEEAARLRRSDRAQGGVSALIRGPDPGKPTEGDVRISQIVILPVREGELHHKLNV